MREVPLSSVEYWRKGEASQNFGDFLSEYLTSHLFFAYRPGVSSVHIVGSVIDDMFVPPFASGDNPVLFWGCGAREVGGLSQSKAQFTQVTTVRGPVTASALGLGAMLPQGDPAFLLPALYKPQKMNWLEGKTICIPHFHDHRDDGTILTASNCDFVVRPNIANCEKSFTEVIDAIYSADFVLASSLHACVVAAAYRRPFAFWCAETIDLPLKWQDLAASLHIPCEFVKDALDGKALYRERLLSTLKVPNLIPSLLRAPLLIRADGLLKILLWYQAEGLDGQPLIDSLKQSSVEHLGREQQTIFNSILDDLVCERKASAAATQRGEELEQTALKSEYSSTDISLRIASFERELSALEANFAARSDVLKGEIGEEIRTALADSRSAHEKIGRVAESVASIERWQADAGYWRRSSTGRLLFRSNGKPVRWVRQLLFHNSGRPRRIFRSAVLDSKGLPRKPFLQWMTSVEYLALPKAYAARPLGGPVTSYRKEERTSAKSEVLSDLARPPNSQKCVLIIDSVYPTADRDSGSLDALNFVRIFMALGYRVYFCATANFVSSKLSPIETEAKRQLENMGVAIIDNQRSADIESFLMSNGRFIDLYFLSRVHSGGLYFDVVRTHSPNSRIVFNTVDLHFVRELREGQLSGNRKKINASYKTRERELYLIRLADAAIVVSEEEQKLIVAEAPGSHSQVIPLIREIPGRNNGFWNRCNIGFVGGYKHSPNVDAVKIFLEAIWPLIRTKLPDVQFHLIGADMPNELIKRTDPGLVVIGHLPRLGDALDNLRLTVAPLRYGAGAKGKVVSSLSHGVPCVCSSIAAEGMNLGDCGGVLVADEPEAFAASVVQAYSDEVLWQQLSDAGVNLMKERHDFSVGLDRMKRLLEDLSSVDIHVA